VKGGERMSDLHFVPESEYYMIRVNRIIRPKYPKWMTRVVHPELECSGPEEFDLRLIDRPLNLQDGEAIAKKDGGNVFRELFGERKLFLFSSVVSRKGSMYVPYVMISRQRAVIRWSWVSCDWGTELPTIHFVRCRV